MDTYNSIKVFRKVLEKPLFKMFSIVNVSAPVNQIDWKPRERFPTCLRWGLF